MYELREFFFSQLGEIATTLIKSYKYVVRYIHKVRNNAKQYQARLPGKNSDSFCLMNLSCWSPDQKKSFSFSSNLLSQAPDVTDRQQTRHK